MTQTRQNSSPNAIVAVLAAMGIVAALMQTLVVPLLGELPALLDTTASNATWVVTVTLLAAAVATPIAGRLGDMFGKRRMILVLTVPLIVGSVVCALSSTVLPMVSGRALQGLGAGVIPLGISLLREVVPAEKLGSSIALISASLGVGGAVGLPFAAIVAENSNWHVLFWVAAGLSAAVGLLVVAVVPADAPNPEPGSFDLRGAWGLSAGLIALLLTVSKGSDWGWASTTTLGFAAVAVAAFLIWGWWELRIAEPLVDLRTTAKPPVLLTNLASVLVGVAMYAQALIVPQIRQLPSGSGFGLGQSMIQMGLWMAPAGIAMMAVSPMGARLSAARTPKVTLVAGAVVIAVGYGASMALLGTTWGLLLVSLTINSGVGLAYGAMPALIMGSVPHRETAAANGFNTLMRSIGTSLAAAVIGVVLAQMTTDFGGRALPSEGGFRVGLLIGCVTALIAAAVASTIPMGGRHQSTREVLNMPAPAPVPVPA